MLNTTSARKPPRMKKFDRTTTSGDSAYQTDYNRKLRREIIDRYGGKCECCGEARKEFLAFNHKNRDGNAMRKIHGQGGRALYGWIKRNNYPDSLNVLCHNCNNSLGFYGYCPHDFDRPISEQLAKARLASSVHKVDNLCNGHDTLRKENEL